MINIICIFEQILFWKEIFYSVEYRCMREDFRQNLFTKLTVPHHKIVSPGVTKILITLILHAINVYYM